MPIITITRGQYSGGEDIAQIAAETLGAKCISDEVLREAASNYHVSEEKLAKTFETNPSMWERITKSRQVYAAYIKAVLVDWCMDNNIVYHGNAGQELLREIPHVLKVRIMVSFEQRVQRIMEQLGYTRELAERTVHTIDADRTKRMRYYYDADWRDPSRYDLLIRMDRLRNEFVVQMILDMAAQPGYQMTEAYAAELRNVHLKSKLYAMAATMLGSHLGSLELAVDGGDVTLRGDFPFRDAVLLDRLLDTVRGMEGVSHVTNDMTAGLAVFER